MPHSTWTGCVTDRTQHLRRTTADAPTIEHRATLFPANQYYENSTAYCEPQQLATLEPIMPLSYDWTTLKTNVNAMQPTGGTNQAIGLAWAGSRCCRPARSPRRPKTPTTTYNRVIILLSDGLNTEDRWPANGDGSTQNTNCSGDRFIDTGRQLLCDNHQERQVDSKGNADVHDLHDPGEHQHAAPIRTSTVLQNCASDPSKFFMLTSSQPDRHHLQRDRNRAQRSCASRDNRAALHRTRKSPAITAGLLILRNRVRRAISRPRPG